MSDDTNESETCRTSKTCCKVTQRSIKLKERMDKVLGLNHTGKNVKEICKILGFPERTVYGYLYSMSKDPNNGVIDNLTLIRQKSKWYLAIKHIKEVILPYYNARGIKPTLRTAFYRLEVDGLIVKRETDYVSLSRYSKYARLKERDQNGELKYPILPIDCFADETRERLDIYDIKWTAPQEMEPPTVIQDPERYIQEAIKSLKTAPGNYDGEGFEGNDGKAGSRWYGQPEYVEVWIEKFALRPVFEKFLEDKEVDIVVNRGYASLTFLYHNIMSLKRRIEKFGEEHVHVLYFGDFDSSGLNMDDSIEYYFDRFGIPRKVLERVALTHEQIEEYHIPTRPPKDRDSRTQGFIEEYGEDAEAAELDAFLATDDEAFEELIQQSVDIYRRQEIYDEIVEEYEVEADPVPKLNADELKKTRHKMYQQIADAFPEGWDEFYKESDEFDYERMKEEEQEDVTDEIEDDTDQEENSEEDQDNEE